MATLTQVRNKANSRLATFWTHLQTKQDSYYAKHGKYFQLLVTGNRQVENDEEYTPETKHPSDEPHQIDVAIDWGGNIPFEIQVNEWVGPNGEGYEAVVTVDYQGKTYRRSRNSDNVDSGWYEVIEEIV